MIDFQKIKLVIWDLDETFWQGTLSEGSVVIPETNQKIITSLTDAGIINSICSKNDLPDVKAVLEGNGLWEYFVFPSVNWEAKGARVKQLIADMQLRPANVLFLDDNHSNREEVKYFCPEITTAGPEIFDDLLLFAENTEKKDESHKRLNQYKLLETKHEEKQQFSSNEEFLMQSNINVEIHTDCLKNLPRIHELILRSNQLNFTKLRSTEEELTELFNDGEVTCAYVTVKDKFGEYGLVGFYAVKANKLIHFLFSCRILGMGIEQYVYNTLGRPELNVIGEVISDLSSPELPRWINHSSDKAQTAKMEIAGLQKSSVLVKGPCDLFQIYPYIANTELFDTDFTHHSEKGFTIESTGHTTHIAEALRLSQAQKELVCREVPFADMDIYKDDIYIKPYKVVFISILADCNLGVYRRKETGEKLAFLEYIHPITDPASWNGLIEKKYPTANFEFTEEILKAFADKYEFIGRNTPEQIVENLSYIRSNLSPDCTLVIMLGGELYYEKNTFEAYKDRHIVHKAVNDAIREFAKDKENIRLLDVNKYLVDQSSFYDHFNHYIKPVYYSLAAEMVDIVNECTGSAIKETGKSKMAVMKAKEILSPLYRKAKKLVKGK